jgi:GlpG protein
MADLAETGKATSMRHIGTLSNEKHARLFSDYLLSQEIKTQVEEEDGTWMVWVRDEDRLNDARQQLQDFQAHPTDEKYRNGAATGAELKRQEHRRRHEASRKTVDVRRDVWSQPTARKAPLTMVLAVACIAVAIFTGLGQYQHRPLMRSLSFADPIHELRPDAQQNRDAFRDIKQGQIWRVATPIFLHYGLPHIAFNLILLFSLGGMLETRRSSVLLGLVVLASAIGGNVGQALVSGPYFGGMSGVVYGLLGFIWIRMHIAPGDGLRVSRDYIIIMMIWMILGFLGVLKTAFGVDVANAAHLCGLVAGVLVAIALPIDKAKHRASG